jgi:uncharacterized protein YecT (DUF1311 family)
MLTNAQRSIPALVLAIGFQLFATAHAQVDESIDCSNPGKLDGWGMRHCAARANQLTDFELNNAFKALRSMLEADHQKLLDAAQKSWIAWRDRECDFETSAVQGFDRTGSIYSTVWAACRESLTAERTKKIRSHLRNFKESRK